MESLGLRLGEHLKFVDWVLKPTYGCKQAESYHKKFGQIGPGKPKLAAKKRLCACAVFNSLTTVGYLLGFF